MITHIEVDRSPGMVCVVKSAGDNEIFFKEALKISIKNHSLNALKQPKKCFYVEKL